MSDSIQRVTAVLSVVFLTGCYTYVPTELSTLQTGTELRVYLTRAAVAALPEEVAPPNLYLTGRLVAQEADSVAVGVPVVSQQLGPMSGDVRQVIKVGTGQVVDVRRREFSPTRTGLFAAGTVGLGAFVIGLIFGADSFPFIGDPNDDVSRVPVGVFPLRLPVFDW